MIVYIVIIVLAIKFIIYTDKQEKEKEYEKQRQIRENEERKERQKILECYIVEMYFEKKESLSSFDKSDIEKRKEIVECVRGVHSYMVSTWCKANLHLLCDDNDWEDQERLILKLVEKHTDYKEVLDKKRQEDKEREEKERKRLIKSLGLDEGEYL